MKLTSLFNPLKEAAYASEEDYHKSWDILERLKDKLVAMSKLPEKQEQYRQYVSTFLSLRDRVDAREDVLAELSKFYREVVGASGDLNRNTFN